MSLCEDLFEGAGQSEAINEPKPKKTIVKQSQDSTTKEKKTPNLRIKKNAALIVKEPIGSPILIEDNGRILRARPKIEVKEKVEKKTGKRRIIKVQIPNEKPKTSVKKESENPGPVEKKTQKPKTVKPKTNEKSKIKEPTKPKTVPKPPKAEKPPKATTTTKVLREKKTKVVIPDTVTIRKPVKVTE